MLKSVIYTSSEELIVSQLKVQNSGAVYFDRFQEKEEHQVPEREKVHCYNLQEKT